MEKYVNGFFFKTKCKAYEIIECLVLILFLHVLYTFLPLLLYHIFIYFLMNENNQKISRFELLNFPIEK